MKKIRNISIWLGLGLFCFQIDALVAQNNVEYKPPQSTASGMPAYPRSALAREDEGFVVLNFMVSTEGNTYDPVIVESSDSIFDQPSLDELATLKFTPATLNGEAVDGSQFYKFTYRITKGSEPERWFYIKEKEFDEALSKGELENAEIILTELIERARGSFHAIARANLAGFYLAKAQGDLEAQHYYLTKALAFDKADVDGAVSALKRDSLPAARSELFKIQIMLKRYGDAMSTFNWMRNTGDEELVEKLRPTFRKLRLAIPDENTYALPSTFNSEGKWTIRMHKRGFYFDQIEGELNEVKLHCQAKSALLVEVEDQQYSIPNNWGICDLYVFGEPNTSFRFVQTAP